MAKKQHISNNDHNEWSDGKLHYIIIDFGSSDFLLTNREQTKAQSIAPRPYKIQWQSLKSEVDINYRFQVSFMIGDKNNEAHGGEPQYRMLLGRSMILNWDMAYGGKART